MSGGTTLDDVDKRLPRYIQILTWRYNLRGSLVILYVSIIFPNQAFPSFTLLINQWMTEEGSIRYR